MSAPRVLALVGDVSGCTLWRIWQPFAELQRRGVFAHWKARDDPENADPSFVMKLPFNFDALVLPRLFWPKRADAEKFVAAIHRTGMAVIVEVDDDVYSPAITERSYRTHELERDKGLEQLEQERLARLVTLSLCDGVTVSSRRLQTIVSCLTDKPVEVVPNFIDTRWFRQVLHGTSRVVPPLTIGWAGGTRYYEDLAPVAEAWGNIAKHYADVTFVVQGHMAEILIDAVPPERCRKLPWLPVDEYPRALKNFDIGCAAVASKLFNTAKTPIKLWEYAMAGVPAVVSPTLYGPVCSDGEDGLIADTAAQWETALRRLIESPELRRSIHRNQRRRIAREHSLVHNVYRWPIAWNRILEAFHARRSRTALLTTV